MKKHIYLVFCIISIALFSCDEYFKPLEERIFDDEIILSKPQYIEGLLIQAYIGLPTSSNFYSDAAADNAVTNVMNSQYRRIATGEWSSQLNPFQVWGDAYEKIFYINRFLELFELGKYSADPYISKYDNDIRDALHKKRLKGEAYGLRAWFKFKLLQANAGKTSDGDLLGFPIIDDVISVDDNWMLPRNTFSECVNSILSDMEMAIKNLPESYSDVGEPNLDPTMGVQFTNRITGRAVKALMSRLLLYASSPAFSEASNINWEQAAKVSGDFLSELDGLFSGGLTFYSTVDNEEVIWRSSMTATLLDELYNFPPSLFGRGAINPSQNLVDAFPMANGYPITDPQSGYDPQNPYIDRDPRLSEYIIYNNSELKSSTIMTFEGAPSEDGIRTQEYSTRTGYYLRKMLNDNVNLDPSIRTSVNQSHTLIRETEIYLNYAEAANEVWGPDADPNAYGFTARTIIRDIRKRAGITQTDLYLNNINSKEEMRNLIRNERRLELCFEDFRFWDIRRWNDIETLQEPVKGVYINYSFLDDTYSFDYREIEKRSYQPHMIYPPVPYLETLKYDDLQQNKGW